MSDWPLRKISEIAQHSLGKMLDKAKNKGEPLPYLRNFNVRWFEFDLSDILEMRFLPEEKEKYTVQRGDLVICEGGYPGRAAIWKSEERVYFQKALHRVRFYEPERAQWCLYYLHAKDLDGSLKEHFNGAGIQHFTGAALARFEIPVPPLPEQERIVAILDEAFEGISTATAHAERNLHNARELFQSVLQSTFEQKGEDWVETTVGEVAEHSLEKMLDKRKNKGELQPYLRNKSVRWFDFDLDDVSEMKFEDGEVERYSAKRGDVLICEGGYPGRAAIWESDDPIFFQKAIHRVRFYEPAFNRWLVYLLYHRDSTGELKDHFTGAGIQHFTGKALAAFPIPVGPVSQVQILVKKLDALSAETRRLEAIYQRKLDALAELKQSLLQRAFAGEL